MLKRPHVARFFAAIMVGLVVLYGLAAEKRVGSRQPVGLAPVLNAGYRIDLCVVHEAACYRGWVVKKLVGEGRLAMIFNVGREWPTTAHLALKNGDNAGRRCGANPRTF